MLSTHQAVKHSVCFGFIIRQWGMQLYWTWWSSERNQNVQHYYSGSSGKQRKWSLSCYLELVETFLSCMALGKVLCWDSKLKMKCEKNHSPPRAIERGGKKSQWIPICHHVDDVLNWMWNFKCFQTFRKMPLKDKLLRAAGAEHEPPSLAADAWLTQGTRHTTPSYTGREV